MSRCCGVVPTCVRGSRHCRERRCRRRRPRAAHVLSSARDAGVPCRHSIPARVQPRRMTDLVTVVVLCASFCGSLRAWLSSSASSITLRSAAAKSARGDLRGAHRVPEARRGRRLLRVSPGRASRARALVRADRGGVPGCARARNDAAEADSHRRLPTAASSGPRVRGPGDARRALARPARARRRKGHHAVRASPVRASAGGGVGAQQGHPARCC